MTNAFYRLAPFIQDYIYRAGWDELRDAQVQTIDAVLDTANHILITSGTASGKTEAAFLPILTQLYEQPSQSIGVLYIGPLKALINDQFYRLDGLLEAIEMPVQAWHGDIAQNKKTKFLRQGQGILQITPESLEAMLMRQMPGDLARLFGDLRFVVIDELHAFISSDRGRQVLCQLQRLARYQKTPARRVGLSATLGEPALAMEWLRGGTETGIAHIDAPGGKRSILLGLEHFWTPSQEAQESGEDFEDSAINPLYAHMHDMVRSANKTLIFANRRGDTETIIHQLKRIADMQYGQGEEGFYVHHGAVSAHLREKAEEDMRNPDKPACVAATFTLEMGIDLGSLDQVLQLDATSTVSSFVQRLGRSGRRGNPAKMFLYCTEDPLDDQTPLGERIPWALIQSIAVLQLYVEEKWLEPPELPHLPLSLLYHQTMSILFAQPGLHPPELAERVLTLSPFKAVAPDQYRQLLRHLQEQQHIQIDPDTREMWIGAKAERLVNDYHFYATFADATEYLVRQGSEEIGTIQSLPQEGDRFALAGRSWRVIAIDPEKRIIQVERSKGKAPANWSSGYGDIHTRVVQRMKQVINEEIDYGYLAPQAVKRLEEVRWLAQTSELVKHALIPLGGNEFMLLPWCGSRILRTLALMLERSGIEVKGEEKFYLQVNAATQQNLAAQLKSLALNPPTASQLVESLSSVELRRNKYDFYVPDSLLRATYEIDVLDMAGALNTLRAIIGE